MLKGYFQLSRKEIKSAFVLFVILLIGWLIPFFFIKPPPIKDKLINAQKIIIDNQTVPPISYDKPNNSNTHLFYFDPNILDSCSWLKLGLKPKTIGTIKKYLKKGGKFNQPNDLKKIWGLAPGLAETLIPFIIIEKKKMTDSVQTKNQNTVHYKNDVKPNHQQSLIDINEAQFGPLIKASSLPPEIVGKIISFRNYLGKFVNIKQIKYTYNLTDSFYFQLLQHIYIAPITLPCYPFSESKAGHYTSLDIFNKKDVYKFLKQKEQMGSNFNIQSLSNIDWLSPGQIDSLKKYFY